MRAAGCPSRRRTRPATMDRDSSWWGGWGTKAGSLAATRPCASTPWLPAAERRGGVSPYAYCTYFWPIPMDQMHVRPPEASKRQATRQPSFRQENFMWLGRSDTDRVYPASCRR